MFNKFCKLVISRSLTENLSEIFDDHELRQTLNTIAAKQIVLVLGIASSDSKAAKIIHKLQPTIQIMRSNQSQLASDYYRNKADYCLSILEWRTGCKYGNSDRVTEEHEESGRYTKVFKFTDKGLILE